MPVSFAVFTFEEQLPDLNENINAVLNYLGAIEQFTGVLVNGGKTHWVVLKTNGLDGYFITMDNPWFKSDKAYLIFHDTIYDADFLTANNLRQTECLKLASLIALPTSTSQQPGEFYMMTRTDRPDRTNFVIQWATDAIKLHEWIVEQHENAFSLDEVMTGLSSI